MIITRSIAQVEEGGEDEPSYIYLLLLQELDPGVGKIMQVVDEETAVEMMPYYLMGANETYIKMGSLSNDASDRMRIEMMAEVGISMADEGDGIIQQPPPREPRRVVVPKKKPEVVEGMEELVVHPVHSSSYDGFQGLRDDIDYGYHHIEGGDDDINDSHLT
jgi:hypothetical protein